MRMHGSFWEYKIENLQLEEFFYCLPILFYVQFVLIKRKKKLNTICQLGVVFLRSLLFYEFFCCKSVYTKVSVLCVGCAHVNPFFPVYFGIAFIAVVIY